MKTKNVIEGLTILLSYCDKKDEYNMCAEHDEIYFSDPKKELTQEDYDKLIDLGWFKSTEYDGWSALM